MYLLYFIIIQAYIISYAIDSKATHQILGILLVALILFVTVYRLCHEVFIEYGAARCSAKCITASGL